MIRVMVVDDEPIIRKGIVNLIDWSAFGCEVVSEAASGLDALEYLESTCPDIVITDIQMPRMNGI